MIWTAGQVLLDFLLKSYQQASTLSGLEGRPDSRAGQILLDFFLKPYCGMSSIGFR